MPKRPILVFDVNETLLNLDALSPAFDRLIERYAAATNDSGPGH